MRARRRHSTVRAALASVLCLWALAISLGWLAPLMTAAVAGLDEEHGVRFAPAIGSARVILTHDRSVPEQVPWHQHCTVAQALTAFASDTASGVDHVLEFPEGASQARLERRASTTDAVPFPMPVVAWVQSLSFAHGAIPAGCPPLVASGASVRSAPLLC